MGANAIARMLKNNNCLSVLLLHWNYIKGQGGIDLADALSVNEKLLVFDCSFNSFGSSEKNQSAKSWKNMLMENKTLVHIDLSHNGFKLQDCTIIAEGLKQNHTILGIHMAGNAGSIDVLGYLNPEKDNELGLCHIFTRIDCMLNILIKYIATLETGNKSNSQMKKLQAYSNCWICEGWTQMKFIFVSGVTAPREVQPNENVFLHLSFEQYIPDYMLPEKAGTYYSLRMVPPGPLNYFFTIGDEIFTAEGVKTDSIPEPIKIVNLIS